MITDDDEMDGGNRLPVNVKVELGAKAELKGEIPSSSLGRLLDALTDAIRPFSEKRGLKADQIRLQREDVLIDIARKARSRAEMEHKVIHPLPLKFLVPFLEKASTEDPESELVDWWASLLASAATEGRGHPIFVEMMGRITAREASFLERLWRKSYWNVVKSFPAALEALSAEFKSEIDLNERYRTARKEEFDEEIRGISNRVICSIECRGIFCRYLRFPTHSFEGRYIEVGGEEMKLYDICVTAGVLERAVITFPIFTPFIGEYNVYGEFFMFSQLGLEFMQACHLQDQ